MVRLPSKNTVTRRKATSNASQVFDLLGKPARDKKCDAIEGIIEEGKEVMEEYADTAALDAGLLAAARALSTTKSRAMAP